MEATAIGHAQVLAFRTDISDADWLAIRKLGIGGSDAAAAVGASEFRSRLYLWAEKTGRIAPREATEPMHWGKVHEQTLYQEFCRRHPELQVERIEASLVHPEHSWMRGNVDGVFTDQLGRRGLLEIKTTGHWMARKWKAGIPSDYLHQVLHYLAVLGPEYRYAIVPVLMGGNHYEERVVWRDDEQIDALVAAEQEFWGYVERDEQPPPDGSEATADTLAEMWSASVPTVVTLPSEAMEWVEARQQAIERQKSAEWDRNEAESQLKAMLQDCERGAVGPFLVRWTNVNVNRVDTTRLKKERPDIAEKYSAESSHRRFTVQEV